MNHLSEVLFGSILFICASSQSLDGIVQGFALPGFAPGLVLLGRLLLLWGGA